MGRLYVVGDIHGCADELDVLLGAVDLDTEDCIVFVGDYIDRGPRSADVVERLLALQRDARGRVVCLKGNHEDMLLAYMGYPGLNASAFLYNGGTDTLSSYGLAPWASGGELLATMPREHLEFFRTLGLTHEAPPYLVVHAGIHPDRGLAEQREADLLWIRDRFVSRPHDLPYTVCFGHTPQRDVLLDLPYKIGLDTGCVYGNLLSCLEVTQGRLLQVAAGATRVVQKDLSPELGCTSSRAPEARRRPPSQG